MRLFTVYVNFSDCQKERVRLMKHVAAVRSRIIVIRICQNAIIGATVTMAAPDLLADVAEWRLFVRVQLRQTVFKVG